MYKSEIKNHIQDGLSKFTFDQVIRLSSLISNDNIEEQHRLLKVYYTLGLPSWACTVRENYGMPIIVFQVEKLCLETESSALAMASLYPNTCEAWQILHTVMFRQGFLSGKSYETCEEYVNSDDPAGWIAENLRTQDAAYILTLAFDLLQK